MDSKQEIINEIKSGYGYCISDHIIKKAIEDKTITDLINACPELPYHLKMKYRITTDNQINAIFFPPDKYKPNFELGDDAFC